MSIFLAAAAADRIAAAPTTVPAGGDWVGYALYLTVPVALVLAFAAGVFRRHSVDGPVRVKSGELLGTLWMIWLAGTFAWMSSIMVYGSVRHLPGSAVHARVGTVAAP